MTGVKALVFHEQSKPEAFPQAMREKLTRPWTLFEDLVRLATKLVGNTEQLV